ncbi:resuscitation-promoting factor [Auritidibacter sp. NML120636]|nr:resuscitation-promoting factor [Auritidibacter sp. NML100628]PXA80135.1 resuscitation-promoting factor [Auritidibacter sp. NML120636]
MSRVFSSSVSKLVAQLAALALVLGGLAAFILTQNNGSAQAQDQQNSGQGEALDIDLASSVQPLTDFIPAAPTVVEVTRAGETENYAVYADTVGEALSLSGIEVGEKDKVSPSTDTKISTGDKITVQVVTTEEVVEEETIEYETVRENDDSLEKGKTKVETKGENGTAEVTYTVTVIDGEESSREETHRQITKEPTDEVVKVGTKEKEQQASSSSSTSSSSSSSSSTSSDDDSEDSSSDDSEESSSSGGAAPSSGVWAKLAQCESGGNWSTNSGNGYYGGLQFSGPTWKAMGGTKYAPTADKATPAQQIEIASKLQRQSGWGQWPACSRSLGLR